MKPPKSVGDLEGLRRARDQVFEALLEIAGALDSLKKPEERESLSWWWRKYETQLKELVEEMDQTIRIEGSLLGRGYYEDGDSFTSWKLVEGDALASLLKAKNLLSHASEFMGHYFGDIWFGDHEQSLPPWKARLERVGYRFYAEWPCMESILSRIIFGLESNEGGHQQ